MGPLETIDLNAPGGLTDYCDRYGPLYAAMQEQMKPLAWDKALVDRLHAARRAELPANMQAVRQEWRDRRLMALLAHKATQVESRHGARRPPDRRPYRRCGRVPDGRADDVPAADPER